MNKVRHDTVLLRYGQTFTVLDQELQELEQDPKTTPEQIQNAHRCWWLAYRLITMQPAFTEAGRAVKAQALLAANRITQPHETPFQKLALSLAEDLVREEELV
jgi:hypothetical protein